MANVSLQIKQLFQGENLMPKAMQILTPEECQKLLNWIAIGRRRYLDTKTNTRDLLITLLMLDAGLRVGEVVQLKVHDLFFGEHPVQTLIVRGAIAKRGIERSIPMSERLQVATQSMHHQHYYFRTAKCTDYAFYRTQADKHLSIRCVQLMLKSAAHHSLGRKIHPHILRHTFATRLMQKTNIRVVQQLLGHASLSSTQIYTHPNSTDLSEAIKAIS